MKIWGQSCWTNPSSTGLKQKGRQGGTLSKRPYQLSAGGSFCYWQKPAFDFKPKRALKDEEEFRKTDWAARFIARAEQSPSEARANEVIE
jgi:hypothetical protein